MKKILILLPVLLVFTTCFTTARSNRFDSNIYNQCVQYYQTQRHNAEAQAWNLWFSKRWVEYLNSLPSDDEIEEQCEYDAENREDRNSWSYYHQLALNAANNNDYESTIEYLENAIYYEPVGSEVYNITYNEIQEAKNILREEQRQAKIQQDTKNQRQQTETNQQNNNRTNNYTNNEDVENYSYYYQLWAKEIENGNYDKWLQYYEKSMEFLNKGSELYIFTEKIIESKKNEYRDYYYQLWMKEIQKENLDEWIKYFEKSLTYENPGSQRYQWTQDVIKKWKEIQAEMNTQTTNQQNTSTANTTTKNTNNIPELNQAITWMYEKWLTVFNEPTSFMAYNWLRRDEAAKFYVQYAKQVMWRTPDYSKQWCNFKDLDKARPDLKDVIVESCQLWLFQWNNWKFMPTQQLTNAQAITVFMRLREWYKDEKGSHFANNYYESAHSQWLLYDTPLDNRENFDKYTTRWDVAKMLFRWQKQ